MIIYTYFEFTKIKILKLKQIKIEIFSRCVFLIYKDKDTEIKRDKKKRLRLEYYNRYVSLIYKNKGI